MWATDPPLCDTSSGIPQVEETLKILSVSRIFPITQDEETLNILGPEWWWLGGNVWSGGEFTLASSTAPLILAVNGQVQGDMIVDVTYDYKPKDTIRCCYRWIGTMTRVSRAVCHDGVVEHDLGEDCENDAACVAQGGTHCSDACICEGSGS